MGHNLIDQLALVGVVVRAHLRRQRHLPVVVVGAGNDVEVDAVRLAVEDLRGGALLAKVDLRAVDLVHHDGRDGAEHLQGKVLRLDHVDRGHERVDDEREAARVLDRHLVGLAADDDGRVVAPADEDRVVELGLDLNRRSFPFVVFLESVTRFC